MVCTGQVLGGNRTGKQEKLTIWTGCTHSAAAAITACCRSLHLPVCCKLRHHQLCIRTSNIYQRLRRGVVESCHPHHPSIASRFISDSSGLPLQLIRSIAWLPTNPNMAAVHSLRTELGPSVVRPVYRYYSCITAILLLIISSDGTVILYFEVQLYM